MCSVKCSHTIQAHSHYLSALAWQPDGRQLASASGDQRVRFWDADKWEMTMTIDRGHNGVATTLAWSEDGRRRFTGGNDGLIKIWNPETGSFLSIIREHQSAAKSVSWWEVRVRMISGSEDASFEVWDPEMGQAAQTLPDALALAWSPDNRQLAVSRWNEKENSGSLTLMDMTTWQTIYNFSVPSEVVPLGMAWSPDGSRLAARFHADEGGQLRVWDLPTHKEIATITNADAGLHGDRGFRSLAWSPDGRLLATAGLDSAVRLWDIETKQCLLTFMQHSNEVVSAEWSPDGRRIASKDLFRGVVLIWEAVTGNPFQRAGHHSKGVGQQRAVGGIVDIGLDRRSVTPQFPATGEVSFLGLGDHALMDLTGAFRSKEGKGPGKAGEIRDGIFAEASKPSVEQAVTYFVFQLAEGPALQMLEHDTTQ